MTTLMRFARRPKAEKIVEALLIHRANIDTKDVFGNTALLWACKKGHQKTVNVLIEMHARTDTRNVFGETAQEVAAKNKLVWPEEVAKLQVAQEEWIFGPY